MRVRGGGAGRTIQTTTTMRVKEHKAKTRTNDSSNRRKMIPQREEQHSREQREAQVVVDDDSRRRNERNEDASRGASSSQRTDAATFAGSALQIRDDYYVDAKWNTNDTRRAVGRGEGDIASDEEEFTFRSASVGESVRSELENARRASASTIAEAAMMMASTSTSSRVQHQHQQREHKTGAVDVIRRDVDDTIDDTVANLLEMIENERLKSSAYEKNLEKTEKAYLETKKESEEIAERLTGAANIISELKSALVHAMREHHDDEKFEDDVNDAVTETRLLRRGGSGSDLSNSVEAVGARRWEAKLRRTVSSALERFTSEARGVPNGDALYRAAKEALDPVVASAIAGVVDEVEIASGKKNKKKKEDKDYFRTNDDVNESYSLDGDDDDDDDDDDDPTNRSREHEQDINALDGRAKLVAWMQMEKAKRKRLTRKLLKTKDELAKSEASRMAATRRWLEAASQLESERGSQFTQSVAGDGMGSSSDEEGFFDDEDESEDDQGLTPRSVESRRTDPGQRRARARKTQSLDGSGDAALFFTQTPTSPSSNKGVRRRKSKSASASLVDPSSPSKNYGTFSPFSPGSGSVPKSALSKRSSNSNRKSQNRKSRLGFEDRIDEEDERDEDEDENRSAGVRSLDVSAEIQKTIQTVTGNPTFRDVVRMIAATVEQFAASPTFELVWPICFITFLVFWRSSVIAFHANTAIEQQQQQRQQQQQQQQQQRILHPRVTRARTPPPPLLLEEKQQREEGHRRPTAHGAAEKKEDAPEEPPLEKAPLPTSRDSSWKAEAVPDGEGENDPENEKNTIKRMTSSKKNNKTSNENEENDVTVVVDGRTSSSSLTFDAVLASIKRFSLESDFELDLIRQRRFLHETPELMWNERETASFIKKELEKLGIVYEDAAEPGILARIPLDGDDDDDGEGEGGNGSGESTTTKKNKIAVLLRADMDALPVTEETNLEFKSKNEGKMHACGHDGHVTMLLGAAKLIKKVLESGEEILPDEARRGKVVYLLFQPAEEGGAGAKKMLESKTMRDMKIRPSTAFALHNWPYAETPSGSFGTRGGTIMAGAGTFEITVTGRGGHAAVPHKNVDAVVCGAKIVTDVQTIVSRKTSALDSVVVTISTFHAGTVSNVMPDEAKLTGTLRSLQPETFRWAMDELSRVANAVGLANGCEVEVSFASREVYPPTVNDAKAAEFAKRVAREIFGKEEGKVLDVAPVMPAEDFSFFANEYPSVMNWIGSYNLDIGAVHPLHSAKFILDESILKNGAAAHAGYALGFLALNSTKF
ncbi:unnamed protein product [Bathycoccus prasinos]